MKKGKRVLSVLLASVVGLSSIFTTPIMADELISSDEEFEVILDESDWSEDSEDDEIIEDRRSDDESVIEDAIESITENEAIPEPENNETETETETGTETDAENNAETEAENSGDTARPDETEETLTEGGILDEYTPTESSAEELNLTTEEDALTMAASDLGSGTCGANLKWRITSGHQLIISGTGDMYDYDSVKSRGGVWAPWSAGEYWTTEDTITSIVVNEGVTGIGENAFSYMTKTASISLPITLNKIGSFAFSYNSGFTEITIPEGVTEIKGLFFADTSLTTVNLPKSVKSISNAAFSGCTSLTGSFDLSGITLVGGNNFYGCSRLEGKIKLSNKQTTIPSSTFAGCSNLDSVEIPESVTSIESLAFGYSCNADVYFYGNAPTFASNAFSSSSLTAYYPKGNSTWTTYVRKNYGGSVTWKEWEPQERCGRELYYKISGTGSSKTLTITGQGDMYSYFSASEVPWASEAANITVIKLPTGIGKVSDYAFAGTNIVWLNGTSNSLPSGMRLGKYTYQNCKRITAATLNYTTTIPEGAFSGCTKLSTVSMGTGVKSFDKYAFENCGLTQVVIPNSVTSLPQYLCKGCKSLTKVSLNSGVTTIDYRAFAECTALAAFEVGTSNTAFSVGDGILYNKNKTKLVKYPPAKTPSAGGKTGSYIVDETVTSFDVGAFMDSTKLKEIRLSTKMTVISSYAFANSTLETITMRKNIQSVGSYAFQNCTSLKKRLFAGSPITWRSVNVSGTGNGAFTALNIITGLDRYVDGFAFANTYSAFYSEEDEHKIPSLERFQQVFEGNVMFLYNQYLAEATGFKGNCFGMCVMSYMFSTGKIDYENYVMRTGNGVNGRCFSGFGTTSAGNRQCTLDEESDLCAAIERYQIYANYSVEWSGNSKNLCVYANYCDSRSESSTELASDAKKLVENINSGLKTYLIIVGTHAVLIDTSELAVETEQNWYRFYVYDPNRPHYDFGSETKISSLYKDPDWYYEINVSTGKVRCSKANIELCNIYDISGLPTSFTSNKAHLESIDASTRTYLSNASNVTITNSAGTVVYRRQNGVTTYAGSSVQLFKPEEGDLLRITVPDDGYTITAGSGYFARLTENTYYGITCDTSFTYSDLDYDDDITITPNQAALVEFVYEYSSGVDFALTAKTEFYLEPGDTCELAVDDYYLWINSETNETYTVFVAQNTDGYTVLEDYTTDELYNVSLCYDFDLNDEMYVDGPELTSVTNVTKGLRVRWEAADFANMYRVFRKSSSGSWTAIGITENTSFIDTNVKYGSKDTYTVRGLSKNNEYTTDFDRTGISGRRLFSDVTKSTLYYYKPVYWAAKGGITSGYKEDNTFRPQETCTRGQMVTFLWRVAGKPTPRTTKNPFTDVSSSDYYYKAVLWAAEEGITKGYSEDNTFRPNDPCLREHAVTFLWRLAGKPYLWAVDNPFTDISSSDYYYMAVLWASEWGIANGYSEDDTYRPKAECMREHIVTFLYRYVMNW